MTWPDFVTIGLCLVLGLIESKRGFVPAFFGLVGAVLTVEIAAAAYRSFFPGLTLVSAYVTTVAVGLAIVAVLTSLIKRYAPTDIGSFDSSLAGLMGICSGLVVAHAVYGSVILGYGGMSAPAYANSLFGAQIYELRGWHAFLDFMSKIGSTGVAEPSGGSYS